MMRKIAHVSLGNYPPVTQRLLTVILLACLVVSGTFFTGLTYAYASGTTVTVTTSHSVQYAGYSTLYAESNGVPIYCAEPNKQSIKDGTYSYTTNWETTDQSVGAFGPIDRKYLIAAVYFGYGGPGFTKSMWPDKWENGSAMDDDKYYALSHLMVSYLYARSFGQALEGTQSEFKEWLIDNVICNFSTNQGTDNPSNTRLQIYQKVDEVPDWFGKRVYMIAGTDARQTYFGYLPVGKLDLQKASSNTAITNQNDCYSLKGAVYGVYTDKACTAFATYPDSGTQAKLATNNSGYAESDMLSPGTYYVKEISASSGYALDTTVYPTTVKNGSTTHVDNSKVYEVPQSNPLGLVVEKYDDAFEYDDEENLPQGSASLEGAEFTVRYYDGFYATDKEAQNAGDAIRTWVFATNQYGRVELAPEYLVSGDSFYINSSKQPCLPLGTYIIEETKAPIGYLLNETAYVCQVTSSGTAETLHTYHAPTVPNVVMRGDVEFTKHDGNDMALMAHVAFLIESITTQERHVVVTDENGYFSSAAPYNSHTSHTNGNDDALTWNDDDTYTVDSSLLDPRAGTWFGMNAAGQTAEPNDKQGALPYDTYRIVELACEANEGRQLIAEQLFTVTRDSFTIKLGTIDDPNCDISTKLVDATDGNTYVEPCKEAAIVDAITYSGLVKNRTYSIQTSLVDTTDDNKILATTETELTAEKAHGFLKLPLAYDTSDLTGHVLAVKHSLSYQGIIVAEHNADLTDTEQMVTVGNEPVRFPALEIMPIEDEHILPDEAPQKVPSVKTGDTMTSFGLIVAVILCAACVLVACAVHRHRIKGKMKKSALWISSADERPNTKRR